MTIFFPKATMVLAIASAFSLPTYAADPVDPVKVDANKVEAAKSKVDTSAQKSPAPVPAESEVVQKVTVSGARVSDVQDRRQSTASKIVYGREELDRNSDSNIADVLKRLPGITIGGRPGRGGDIRMRGMGNGYTQILLNGERAPRGFSMDSIPPEQVERIEIIRGPVAEYSTQAIAGTINIVLRQEFKQKNSDLKLSATVEDGVFEPNISFMSPGQLGDLSYDLNGTIFQNQQHDHQVTHIDEQNTLGSLSQDLLDKSIRRTTGINLAPRISYKAENGDVYTLQQFVMTIRNQSESNGTLNQKANSIGVPAEPAAEYASYVSSGDNTNTFGRLFGEWQHRFPDNSKLNLKLGGGFGHVDSSSVRKQYDASDNLTATIVDASNVHDRSWNIGGKYSSPIVENHTLASGIELEVGKRDENYTSLRNGLPQSDDSGTDLNANTRRIAAFVQDEFDINEQWSAYAGVRWEGIRTSSSSVHGDVENTSSVWSPVLHAVWRIPGQSKDQIRSSYTYSYRAPNLNDLIAVPTFSPVNSPSRPDRAGNPNLKPELGRGLDLAYEHYLGTNSIIGANFFYRNIDDLIRRQTNLVTTSTGPRWLSTPVNVGHASTKGIELEAKFQLKDVIQDAPAVDVRSNYSHFWSSVDDIQGPNNRLDSQPVQTGNVGLDYRPNGLPVTIGGGINWTPGYQTQTSNMQLTTTGLKRQYDMYALWRLNPTTQIRFAANNISANDALSGVSNTQGGINHVETANNTTYRSWTVRLELKI